MFYIIDLQLFIHNNLFNISISIRRKLRLKIIFIASFGRFVFNNRKIRTKNLAFNSFNAKKMPLYIKMYKGIEYFYSVRLIATLNPVLFICRSAALSRLYAFNWLSKTVG